VCWREREKESESGKSGKRKDKGVCWYERGKESESGKRKDKGVCWYERGKESERGKGRTNLGEYHASLLPLCGSESNDVRGFSIELVKVHIWRERCAVRFIVRYIDTIDWLSITFLDLYPFERGKVLDICKFFTFDFL
jgi:hypothetical protein